jgi:hypothetical protein
MRANRSLKTYFPDGFQDSGLNGCAIHTSGHTIAGEFIFPLTGLTTVAPSPL